MSVGGGGGGDDNPEGFPTTGTDFYVNDFSVQDSGDVQDQSFVSLEYGAYGIGGANQWRMVVGPNSGSEEANCGWLAGSQLGVDVARRVYYDFTLRMSSAFGEAHRVSPASPLKFLDVRQYFADGSGLDDGSTSAVDGQPRFIAFLGRAPEPAPTEHLRFSATPGGAGAFYTEDGVNTPLNLESFIYAEHAWFCVVVQEGDNDADTWIKWFYKRQGDAGVTKFLELDGTHVFVNPPDPDQWLGHRGRGFGAGERTLCGYLEMDNGFVGDGTEWVTLGNLGVTNYWRGPPAGLGF